MKEDEISFNVTAFLYDQTLADIVDADSIKYLNGNATKYENETGTNFK